jgi:hypothetical protein
MIRMIFLNILAVKGISLFKSMTTILFPVKTAGGGQVVKSPVK